MPPIIVIAIILAVIIAIINVAMAVTDNDFAKWRAKKRRKNQTQKENQAEDPMEQNEKLPYHFKYLLTKNEWDFYKKMKVVADKHDLHIIAKVRLADLVEVDDYLTGNAFNKYFWKIQAKHVDFVLCNPSNLAVLAIVELDDSSHNASAERAERDDFVDKVLQKCNYKIIHTYNGTSDFEEILQYHGIIK